MEMLMETKGMLLSVVQLIKADMNLQQSINSENEETKVS